MHPPSVSLQPSEPVLAPSVPAEVVSTSAPTTAATSPSVPDTSAAVDAKRASQKALENGQLAQAITLGERSVELDPTDAEAWLILGAAYLQRGSFKDARRCFSSCVTDATHGARRECAALLR